MGSSSMRIAAIVFYLCFLTFVTFHNCFCNGNSNIVCSKTEKQALLKFKQDLKDFSNRLSSWAGDNCCQWSEVVCDYFTGHVHVIHRPHNYSDADCHYKANYSKYEAYWCYHQLGGKIDPSLLDLKHLRHLDLSRNDFGGICIPSFIGSIASLRYLNLSYNGFSGAIPHQLGNLTMMRYLDLSWNDFGGICLPRFVGSIGTLRYLHLSCAGFNRAIPHQLGNLTMMCYLDLSGNHFEGIRIPSFIGSIGTLSFIGSIGSLRYLHLYYAGFSGAIYLDLHYLDLSWNDFGRIRLPSFIGSIGSLRYLDLSNTEFSGAIPHQLGNLTMIRYLDLSRNYLGLPGQIPLSTQLQSFENSSFVDNKLYGPPLPNCDTDKAIPKVGHGGNEEGEGFLEVWFYAISALGFVVVGPLLFKMHWRIA
ncbi:receptor-like protein EIX1 [Camellia sinensis]|uniref:receptor-like protein EIX1 n=1 Tax=Camellia sinensis TaxID=4442 RepID=UPI001035B59C|nr:receptor-like protein EIX1 [Camellia sinensis]